MDKLKPCPFCGGEAAFLGETQSIKCKQCGGMLVVTNPLTTRLEAKEAWDRRVNDATVRHGAWYLLDDCANAGLYCSACSKRVHREEFAYKKLRSKYCPHCGALMDGGNEGEREL